MASLLGFTVKDLVGCLPGPEHANTLNASLASLLARQKSSVLAKTVKIVSCLSGHLDSSEGNTTIASFGINPPVAHFDFKILTMVHVP